MIKTMGEAIRQSRPWDGMNTATGSNWERGAGSKAHWPEESKGNGCHNKVAHKRRSTNTTVSVHLTSSLVMQQDLKS